MPSWGQNSQNQPPKSGWARNLKIAKCGYKVVSLAIVPCKTLARFFFFVRENVKKLLISASPSDVIRRGFLLFLGFFFSNPGTKKKRIWKRIWQKKDRILKRDPAKSDSIPNHQSTLKKWFDPKSQILKSDSIRIRSSKGFDPRPTLATSILLVRANLD